MSRSWRARALDSLVSAAAADPAPGRRYAVCVGVSLAAVAARWAASAWLGPTAPFALFLPAVVVSAGYGGLWPGLLSTVLLTAAGAALFEQPFLAPASASGGGVRTFFFVLNGVAISVLADVLHHARRRVRHLEQEREDAEALRATERLHRQAMALASLSEALRVSETADLLIAQGLSGFGAVAGGVALAEAGEAELVIRRSVGYPTGRPRTMPLDQGPAEEALRTRRLVAVPSMAEFARRYPGLADLRQRVGSPEAMLMAPLLLQDRALGVLFVGFASPRAFTAEDLSLFEMLASHGAPALERAQRYEEERAARLEAEASDARHRLLADVSVLLAARPTPEEALPDLARRLVPELADACVVHVVDADGLRRRAAVAHAVLEREPELTALCDAALQDAVTAPLARALGADEPARIEEVSGWRRSVTPAAEGDLLEALDITGAVSAPLRSRGRFLGRLALLGCGSGRRPGSQDLRIAAEVADRTALALDGARLLAEAQRLNRVKDEFLAMLSHELRTPLGAVLLWADLLATERLEAGPARAAEMIGRSTRSLSFLIEELLDVSRIVAGKLTIDPHSTVVRSLLEGIVEGARPGATAKGLALELTVRGEFPVMWADSNRLRQVFENVITNAVKFTPAGGEIAISLERLEGRARIRVRDTGVGMRQELLPLVFERFRQGDSSSRRVQGGLGLGLTIAQHIVDLHDGRISAWSEGEGRGSTFTIELPLTPPPAAVAALLPAGAEQSRPLAGRRVLVVDDHEDTLRGIGVALEAAGAVVRCAGSARIGLDQLRDFDPHALVSDIAMPEMDGFDLIRTVRSGDSAHRELPAIAVSAYASREDRQRALAAGFLDHLPKPVDIPRLVDALLRLVAEAPAGEASPRA